MAIVPINRETHAKLRLPTLKSYGFAKSVPVVRATAGELAQIAANFPVVFIEENGVMAPFAMMGLAEGENLFISERGEWQGLYVPALLRRYPFMLGKATNGADGPIVLVDDSTLSESEGEPLFGPDKGEPSGPVARAIQFLGEVEAQSAQAVAMTKTLKEHGLVEPLPLQISRGAAAPMNLAGLFTVSEVKLNALSDPEFLELRRNSALALAYAQLLSLGQFSQLQLRASAQPNKP